MADTNKKTRNLPGKDSLGAARQVVMFGLGAYGFVHELVEGAVSERPYILALCGLLMGLDGFVALFRSAFGKEGAEDDKAE
jgi:hypothetical protein